MHTCLRVSIAVKGDHDHGSSYKRKHLIGGLVYSLEVKSIVIMVGSKAAYGQTWCRRRSWEFYIWVGRQQEEKDTY